MYSMKMSAFTAGLIWSHDVPNNQSTYKKCNAKLS